jgi:hypothetical protein
MDIELFPMNKTAIVAYDSNELLNAGLIAN